MNLNFLVHLGKVATKGSKTLVHGTAWGSYENSRLARVLAGLADWLVHEAREHVGGPLGVGLPGHTLVLAHLADTHATVDIGALARCLAHTLGLVSARLEGGLTAGLAVAHGDALVITGVVALLLGIADGRSEHTARQLCGGGLGGLDPLGRNALGAQDTGDGRKIVRSQFTVAIFVSDPGGLYAIDGLTRLCLCERFTFGADKDAATIARKEFCGLCGYCHADVYNVLRFFYLVPHNTIISLCLFEYFTR